MQVVLNYGSLSPTNDVIGVVLFSLVIVLINLLFAVRSIVEGRLRSAYAGLIGMSGFVAIFKLSPETMSAGFALVTMAMLTLYCQVKSEAGLDVTETS